MEDMGNKHAIGNYNTDIHYLGASLEVLFLEGGVGSSNVS